MPRSSDLFSPYALVRSTTDPAEAAASLLRFVDETTSRTVQPGQGRRGEHGVIASGRVIPTVDEHDEDPSSSSRTNMDTSISNPTTAASSPRTSPIPFTTVRRVVRRKEGVFSPSPIMKSIGDGTVNRPESFGRLLAEARSVWKNAHPGCFVSPRRDDLYHWTAVLEGPPGTAYEGGTFFCKIRFPLYYPVMPPKVQFLTRIYHCNVNAYGEVSIDILNQKWRPSMSIYTVRSVLTSLFYSCDPEEALVASISKEYRENRAEFNKTARIWTLRYAV